VIRRHVVPVKPFRRHSVRDALWVTLALVVVSASAGVMFGVLLFSGR